MAYSTKVGVKPRLGIEASDTSYDTVLDSCIAAVDAEIDAELKQYTSVPLSPVPAAVAEISADLAAVEFKLWREPERTDEWLKVKQEALRKLERYILKTYSRRIIKASKYRHIDESKRYPEA